MQDYHPTANVFQQITVQFSATNDLQYMVFPEHFMYLFHTAAVMFSDAMLHNVNVRWFSKNSGT